MLPRFLPATSARWVLVALAACTILSACGAEESVSLPALNAPSTPAPTPSPGGQPSGQAGQPKVTLSQPSASAVTAGSTGVTVTATVLDANGNPAPAGTTVVFTVSPSAVAKTSPATASTNASGLVTVAVTGVRAGSASITARALSVTSSAASLSVAPPTITLAAPQPASISASLAGSGGSAVTATVRDQAGNLMPGQAVTFTSSLGQLTPVSSPSDGQYQVTLTSTEVGTALVTAEVLGARSDAVSIPVEANVSALQMTLTPTPSRISPGGSSSIAIQAKDNFGNSVNPSVELTTDRGTLAGSPVALSGGQGTVILTAGPGDSGPARVTAKVGGVARATADVQIAINVAGEPAIVTLEVDPATGIVDVAGVGGTETATLRATVKDGNGEPIADPPTGSNIDFVILDGPQGGERLVGGSNPASLTLSTAAGVATATFRSGTRPGTVRLQIRVTRAKNGDLLTPPITFTFPAIDVRSGPPVSVVLDRSNQIESPGEGGQGTLTHEYVAELTDRYGNHVPDGTPVYFGQIMNILAEGTLGATTAGSTVFTQSDGASFLNLVSADDTLILYDDQSDQRGGYLVAANAAVPSALVTLIPFPASESAASLPGGELRWAVGNNKGGGVLSEGETQLATVKGVARWHNTYLGGRHINNPVYIYAETQGRSIGDARPFTLAWAAPTQITLTGLPDALVVNSVTSIIIAGQVTDSSTPTPYHIPNLPVAVSATAGGLAGVPLATTPRIPELGDPGGFIPAFTWTIPALLANQKVTLSVVAGGIERKVTLTAQ